MKTRVLYFALAVAAAAIASSCVKEQAEPMDPEAEITGQVFEASHEVITKSTLVDLTPTWVEGDQISVTGSDETSVCTFVAGTENKFQTEEGVKISSPYYAIYPAADGHSVNRETGVFTATVPSLQKIDVKKEQNVAQGALVAVAQSETPELQFKNAVGLVKINIARNDIMAVKIEGLGENEFVAGQFTMKLNGDEEPEIALVEGTGVTSVTLNTVEEYGMFTPGEYYATVLPCNLSGIKVTFSRKTFKYDENGEVTGTGSETISVQKQSAAEIKRNAGTDLGTFFTYEISTAADLLAWNKAVAKWTVWDNVVLTDNIDCSTIKSEDWTPNEFKGVFDGNGKTIDNLVIENAGHAAFFRKLQSAVVKDVTFGEGCSFTSTAPVSDIVYAASLAGEIRGGCTITNVVNKGAVTVSATSGTSGDYVGGIGGYFLADSDSRMTGCKNYGTVTYSATAAGPVYCAGVAALAATKVDLTMTGCENHGTVLFTGDNTAAKDINLGGITGIANTVTFDSCVNLGTVRSNAAATNKGATNIGGIVGIMNNACGTITACVNGSSTDSSKGALTNDSPTSNVVRMGGFVGSVINNPINVTGFKNYGPVTNNGAVSNWTALGGVVGHVGGLGTKVNEVSECENYGKVYNTQVKNRTTLGGIVGFVQNANTKVASCSNYGEIKNTGNATHGVTLGGIVGRIEGATSGNNTISLCHNYKDANVIFDAASANDALLSGVGGIIGGHAGSAYSSGAYHKSSEITITGCTNAAEVTKKGAGSTNVFIGGIAGFLNGVLESGQSYTHVANVTSCENKSTAVVLNESTGSGEWYTYTGGIVGYHRVSGKVELCNNYGSVTNKTVSNKASILNLVRIGGIVGSADNGTMTDCINGGEVKDDSDSNAGCVGGIAGYVTSRAMTMTNCDNTKPVSGKFNSSSNPFLVCIGGAVGNSEVALTLTGCDNSGNIISNRTTTATGIYLGGLVGRMINVQMNLSNAKVSGTMMSNHTENSSKTCLGGLVGICYANNITDCHSTMSITNTCAGGNAFVGGLAGQIESGITTVISNCSVNSTISAGGAGNDGMLVGRLTHQTAKGSKTTVTNVYVKGTFNGTTLSSDDYTSHVFGTQDFGVTSEIKFGDFK